MQNSCLSSFQTFFFFFKKKKKLVRIFLLWEDFQPHPNGLVCNLEKLVLVNKEAERRELILDVTFFTGHMSGPNWIPAWMLLKDAPKPAGVMQVISNGETLSCGYKNPYVDGEKFDLNCVFIVHETIEESVLAAEELLITSVVSALKGSQVVWNLANEPDLVAIPSVAEANAWCRRMVKTIRSIDKTNPITCGFHAPSLREEGNGFRVDLFEQFDVPVIHGYPMYAAGWARSPLDAEFVPNLCQMTSAMNRGRPCLAEEFGGCTLPGASQTMEFSSYGAVRKQVQREKKSLSVLL
jgi:endo-1,4-beta-mannosidase